MALAAIVGKGSPELVRFWSEPPLVREPDTLIYGLVRVDPPEVEFLTRSPMRHVYAADIKTKDASIAAQSALEQLHANSRDFVLHLDLDIIASEDLAATTLPDSGGLSLADVQASLTEFVKSKNLLGLDVAQFNPEKDPDGSGGRKIVDLLVEALRARLGALNDTAAPLASTPGVPLTIEAPPAHPAEESARQGTATSETISLPLEQEPSVPETTPPEPTTTEPPLPTPETPEPSAPEPEPAPPEPEAPQPEHPETNTTDSVIPDHDSGSPDSDKAGPDS
jgi:hypothetical protein